MHDLPLVLIVEDEPKIASLLQEYLQEENFLTHWESAGDAGETFIRDHQPDLVILDLMLPGKNGLEVCKAVRSYSDVPIIMLTSRVEEIDRLLGLESGADDYVCKPFSPREVVARVKAILRRTKRDDSHPQSAYRNLVIDEIRHEAKAHGQLLSLTRVEFRMLSVLSANPGRVYSREKLLDAINIDGRVVSDRTVDSHIKNLRKKLRGCYAEEEVIHSIYGVGYKFE